MFQQSCVKFNLLSQKAFNPFYTVILLNLMPKWGHLEEKTALSPTKTIKISNDSHSLVCETGPQKCKPVFLTFGGLYFERDHPEKHDHCIILSLPHVFDTTELWCDELAWI